MNASPINDDTIKQLQQMADEAGQSLSSFLEQVSRYVEHSGEGNSGSGPRLAKSAREAGLHLSVTDVSQRADEILGTEYADYLYQRMSQDTDG